MDAQRAQLCPTLCDPTDCSLPDSSVHGIFQARILEWVAISFSIYAYGTEFLLLLFLPLRTLKSILLIEQ